MTAQSSHNFQSQFTSIARSFQGMLLSALVLQLLFSFIAISQGVVWAYLPAIGLVGLLTLARLRWGLLALVVLWFVPVSLAADSGVFPADILLMAITLGYVIQRLMTGRPLIVSNPLNRWVLLFMVALTISWLLSAAPGPGFINWGHHIMLLLFFYVLVGLVETDDVRRCTLLFIGICLVLSLWNIRTFMLASGDIRAFGPAGTLITGFLSLAASFGTCKFLLTDRSSKRFAWGVIVVVFVVGQFVNQSRGAMIQMMTGMMFAAFIAHRWGRIHGQPDIGRRIFTLVASISLVGLTLLISYTPMIIQVLERYMTQSGNALATANMRFFLWKSAVKTFMEYPIFGIGLAQENVWQSLLPSMRFDPLFFATRGLSIHNSMLGYLSSTGLFGSLVLVILLAKSLFTGIKLVPAVRDRRDASWQLGIWSIVFVIVTRYLYEGHLLYSISGITTITFIAFLSHLAVGARKTIVEPQTPR